MAAPTLAALTHQVTESDSLLERVHHRAVTASPAEMAAYLQDVFGQQLTALMTGIDNPKTVGRWARGQAPHPATGKRLRDAYQIALLLDQARSRQTAQSWFMGMNPHLGDRSPAIVLADDAEGAHVVMQAARTFLAHG